MKNTNTDKDLKYLIRMLGNSESYLPLIEGLIKRIKFHSESFNIIKSEYVDIHHTSVAEDKRNKESALQRQIEMSKKYANQLLEEVSKLKSLAELELKLIEDNMVI